MAKNSETVAVIGAGKIGVCLAALIAAHGHEVRLHDVREDFWKSVTSDLKSTIGEITDDVEETMSRIIPHAELAAALESATLVQETGPENPEIKQSMFADFESFPGADTLLVSSTSGIPPAVNGRRMQNPARVMNGHPFNPPHKIPLVEVCPADVDNAESIKRLMAFYESCDRVPVLLRKPVPGFVVNRLQSAMLREAIQLVSDGGVDMKGVNERTLTLLKEQVDRFHPLDRIDEFANVRDARQDAIVKIQSNIPLPGMK